MSETLIETIIYKGYSIEKHYDFNAENPFENWDGQGRFYHWKDNGNEELARYCELLGYDQETREQTGKEHPDAVRIDKYEHSGISYSVAGEGMNCRWDTSHTWAVWFPDDCLLDDLKRFKTAKTRRTRCVELARQSCKLFNQWANGEVYGFKVIDPAGNDIDSCWGYYGYESIDEEIENQKKAIDKLIMEAAVLVPQLLN